MQIRLTDTRRMTRKQVASQISTYPDGPKMTTDEIQANIKAGQHQSGPGSHHRRRQQASR